jgi:hypothetical protein
MSSDTTSSEPTDVFDVDAWLEEAALPQRSVTVYGRGDLLATLEDLAADRDRHARQPDPAPTLNDPRLGGDTSTGRVNVDALDDRIARVRGALQQSALTLHIRAVLNTERQELVDKHTTKTTDPDTGRVTDDIAVLPYEHELVANACVAPRLTPDQVAKLHQRIGEAQWVSVVRTLERASGETIDTPLSQLG